MVTDCYCTQFRRSANVLTSIYDEELRPVGLKIAQFTLLRSLEHLGSSTYSEIAIYAALDDTTISRNLALLIDAGLARASAASKADARFKCVQLTTDGRRLLHKAEPYWRTAQRRVEEGVQSFINGPAKTALSEVQESLKAVTNLTALS